MKRLFALSLLLLSSAGCSERQADGPESDLLPVCMVYPARGFDEQGKGSSVLDPDGSSGRTCDCLTHEEFEQDLRLDEFHERALQECLQLATAFASNDCQDMHDEGGWLILMLLATGDEAWLTIGKDIPCSEQAAARGCATTGRRSSPVALLALLLICSYARQRRGSSPHRRVG